ncbi:MAG: hypothetical protein IPL61_11185 [Myxococcales bacterium]|nr:hypothetical protein [Myxococcales bacterium]
MRWAGFVVVFAAAVACGPKVNPQSPFDEDDPRAGAPPIDAGASIDGAEVAVPAPGLRATTVTQAALIAVLDAGPGELLKGLEVSAERPGGVFAGWRLVRLLPKGSMFATLDLAPGDLLTGVNGHTLESPPDLATLWGELRTATAIEASITRGAEAFTVRADVTP